VQGLIKSIHQVNTLLELFALFLEKNGYTDIDWRTEEPFAIDQFRQEHAREIASIIHDDLGQS